MNLNDFEKKIKLSFKKKQLLRRAFIHRSYLNEAKEKDLSSNERLEFLGDAVLEFLTSIFLFQNFPKKTEGELTNLRAAVVCAKTLSKIAQQLDLGLFLRLSRGEEKEGGRGNPSILADTFEAILGAIYLDQGIEVADKFLKEQLFPYAKKLLLKENLKDPKSLFQEIVQERIKISPEYKVLEEEGPDHAKRFKVGVFVLGKEIGVGTGKSKQEAEEKAANLAIKNWQIFTVRKKSTNKV